MDVSRAPPALCDGDVCGSRAGGGGGGALRGCGCAVPVFAVPDSGGGMLLGFQKHPSQPQGTAGNLKNPKKHFFSPQKNPPGFLFSLELSPACTSSPRLQASRGSRQKEKSAIRSIISIARAPRRLQRKHTDHTTSHSNVLRIRRHLRRLPRGRARLGPRRLRAPRCQRPRDGWAQGYVDPHRRCCWPSRDRPQRYARVMTQTTIRHARSQPPSFPPACTARTAGIVREGHSSRSIEFGKNKSVLSLHVEERRWISFFN